MLVGNQLRNQDFRVIIATCVIDNEFVVVAIFVFAFGYCVIAPVEAVQVVVISISLEWQCLFSRRKGDGASSILGLQSVAYD